jgi:hypothetical protein
MSDFGTSLISGTSTRKTLSERPMWCSWNRSPWDTHREKVPHDLALDPMPESESGWGIVIEINSVTVHRQPRLLSSRASGNVNGSSSVAVARASSLE